MGASEPGTTEAIIMTCRAQRIFHEKQVAGLCAVHCLNALLQCPMFTAVDLAQMARELDDLERQMLIDGAGGRTDGAELLSFLAQDSSNVAEDGNYSIQVLQRALEPFQLELQRATPAVAADLDQCHAFIANQGEHWLCQRRIGDDWWNLNSLLDAPAFLRRFHVEAYLASLVDQGYDLFLVKGDLPPANDTLDGVGQWFNAVREKGDVPRLYDADGNLVLSSTAASDDKKKTKHTTTATTTTTTAQSTSSRPATSAADDEEEDLRRAIEASLSETPNQPSTNTERTDSTSKKRSAPIHENDAEDDDDDEEMKKAIAMSLK